MKRIVGITGIALAVAVAATVSIRLHNQAKMPEDQTLKGNGVRSQTEHTRQSNISTSNETFPSGPSGGLVAGLGAIRAQSDRGATLQPSRRGLGKAVPEDLKLELSASNFLGAFTDAVNKGDSGGISALLQKVPGSAECVERLKALVTSPGGSKDIRRYAAEALVRIGTQESVTFVLDQALAAQRAGDASGASLLLHSLDSQTTMEGARPLFDLLLGTGRYVENRQVLPEEFRGAVRKALRNVPDRESIGNLAAQLYLDAQSSGHNEALSELFDGVAHPNMLAALAVRSSQAGSQDNAVRFLDRLARVGDQAVVQALVQAGSTDARLFNAAAERLYAWSLQHPQQAQPGLFLEYVTDSKRTPNERILAAYGLAGVTDTTAALRTYSKALAEETDSGVKASLLTLHAYLTQADSQK